MPQTSNGGGRPGRVVLNACIRQKRPYRSRQQKAASGRCRFQRHGLVVVVAAKPASSIHGRTRGNPLNPTGENVAPGIVRRRQ